MRQSAPKATPRCQFIHALFTSPPAAPQTTPHAPTLQRPENAQVPLPRRSLLVGAFRHTTKNRSPSKSGVTWSTPAGIRRASWRDPSTKPHDKGDEKRREGTRGDERGCRAGRSGSEGARERGSCGRSSRTQAGREESLPGERRSCAARRACRRGLERRRGRELSRGCEAAASTGSHGIHFDLKVRG